MMIREIIVIILLFVVCIFVLLIVFVKVLSLVNFDLLVIVVMWGYVDYDFSFL